jgi:hypothetical protein
MEEADPNIYGFILTYPQTEVVLVLYTASAAR